MSGSENSAASSNSEGPKTDLYRHLCSSCEKSYPEDDAEIILFGQGVGLDNICWCDSYYGPEEKGRMEDYISAGATS